MRIYLDVCCLHRPFDDQSQERIRLESEAVKLVFDSHAKGQIDLVGSEAIEDEVLRNPDEEKRSAVWSLLQVLNERLVLDERALSLARSYAGQGMGRMDAVHLALAEVGDCDILLTTDDLFLQKVRTLLSPPRVRVDNPAKWVVEVLGQ